MELFSVNSWFDQFIVVRSSTRIVIGYYSPCPLIWLKMVPFAPYILLVKNGKENLSKIELQNFVTQKVLDGF